MNNMVFGRILNNDFVRMTDNKACMTIYGHHDNLENNEEGYTHFSFSHLHKDRKVRQVIATAHNVIVSFVDQSASSVWPRTVKSTPAQEAYKLTEQ